MNLAGMRWLNYSSVNTTEVEYSEHGKTVKKRHEFSRIKHLVVS